MNTSTETRVERAPHPLVDWIAMTKPRIASFVALASYVGGWLATGGAASAGRLGEMALYVTCTAAAASLFNAVLERDTDALMERTRNRPLPTGRIGVAPATLVGALLVALGTTGLALRFEPLAALLALATVVAYALIYTPLKRVTTFNTLVGAFPGAAPPLIGHVALTGDGGVWGWSLFGLLFVWQFPHFLSIAWLYREDYRRAGLKMLASVPGAEGLAGRQSFLHCLPILPVSLLPILEQRAGIVFAVGALAAGGAFLLAAAAFARREDERNARRLLRTSLLYLPLVLGLAVLDTLVAVQ
jgi:protoheme IX farnesyltransferase